MKIVAAIHSGQAATRPVVNKVGMPLRGSPYFGLDERALTHTPPETIGTASERHPYLVWTPLARLLCAVFFILLICHPLRADDPVTLAPIQEETIAKLYGPVEREAELEEFATRAAAVKVPDQTVVEARLAYGIRTRTLDEHLKEAVRQLDNLCQKLQWRKEDSRLFNSADEAEGVLSFARALFAAQDKNEPEYERCMKEAFWKNPGSGPVLAGELRTHREMASLLNLTIPMHKRLKTSVGEEKTLDDFATGKKALLLVFWTADNPLSLELIDPLKANAVKLSRGDVETVWINVQDARGSAERVRRARDVKSPWLVDSEERPLSKLLRVDSLPRAVLVDPNGRVRYHGYPLSAELDTALRDLGVETTAD